MIEEKDLHELKILIIDDEPANIQLLERILEEEGYSVIRFWNNEVLKETGHVLEKILLTLKPPDLRAP